MNELLSHRTAIARSGGSLPMQWIGKHTHLQSRMKGGDTALDYGCGRGRDADHFGMERFDPYFFPFAPRRRFDIITCIYVLNVVGKKTGTGIVKSIQGLLRRDGAAYIAVRNDVEKDTKSQRRVRLSTNNRHLDIPIHVCRGFAVYKVHKNDRVEVS